MKNIKKLDLICTSNTLQNLTKMINEFYYSKNYIIKNGKAYNTKLKKEFGKIVENKRGYHYYL